MKIFILLIIAALIMPRWIDSVKVYITEEYLSGFHGVEKSTYDSYRFLRNHVQQKVVIVIVNHPTHVAYVSVAKVLTEKDLFLSGEGVRQQVTPEIEKRRTIVKRLQGGYVEEELSVLRQYNVKYLYYYGAPPMQVEKSPKLKVMFKNSAATILMIK